MDTELVLSTQQLSRLKLAIQEQKKPKILLFRILGPQLQKMFTEWFDVSQVPRLLLHGNPHLDNYARTHNGAGLVDFDRSRIGPSLWDIFRALTSITFWSEDNILKPNSEVSRCLIDAYLQGINDRLAYWETPDFLRQIRPKKYQTSPRKYLKGGKKWVKKLQNNLVDPEEAFYAELYQSFVSTQPDNSLKYWQLTEAAEVAGSMGKKHYVYLLASLVKTREPILLDIKETYSEEDNAYFHNPFGHEGKRMVAASRIYSPGLEERIGYCRFQEADYWVRQIPSFSVKVPEGINHDQSLQLAFAIGLQLGRAHRIVDEIYTDAQLKEGLIDSAEIHYDELLKLAEAMNEQVLLCYQKYQSK